MTTKGWSFSLLPWKVILRGCDVQCCSPRLPPPPPPPAGEECQDAQRVSHITVVPKYRNNLGGFPSDFWALEVKQNPLDAYVAFGQGSLSCAGAIL